MQDEDIRDEVQSEMESLLHKDEDRVRILDSNTLKAPISEVMLRELATVPPDATVQDAVGRMVDVRQGCLLVTTGDHLDGIFTERDILTRVLAKGRSPSKTRVRDVMTPDPETLTVNNMIAFALSLMHLGGYRHVPIVDEEERPLGVLSVRDVMAYLADFFPADVHTLPPRPGGSPPLYGG